MLLDLKNAVIEGTKYTGRDNDIDLQFSASMLGNDMLQNYLTVIHGTQPVREISDATLGSVFHLGMEKLIRDSFYKPNDLINSSSGDVDVEVEMSMTKKMSNGWTLTGTADLVIIDSANKTLEIHDYKLTKKYKHQILTEDFSKDAYFYQLLILEFLLKTSLLEDFGEDVWKWKCNLFCQCFVKDANKMNNEVSLYTVDMTTDKAGPGRKDFYQAYEMVVEETNELLKIIEEGKEPEKCDTWMRKPRGYSVAIPTRCMFYCNMGKEGKCKHFKPNSAKNIGAQWG